MIKALLVVGFLAVMAATVGAYAGTSEIIDSGVSSPSSVPLVIGWQMEHKKQ